MNPSRSEVREMSNAKPFTPEELTASIHFYSEGEGLESDEVDPYICRLLATVEARDAEIERLRAELQRYVDIGCVHAGIAEQALVSK
jgi:hypothetical protein